MLRAKMLLDAILFCGLVFLVVVLIDQCTDNG
jgi:hypothetical protein